MLSRNRKIINEFRGKQYMAKDTKPTSKNPKPTSPNPGDAKKSSSGGTTSTKPSKKG